MPSEGPLPRVILLTRSCIRKKTPSGVWEAIASRTHGKCGQFRWGPCSHLRRRRAALPVPRRLLLGLELCPETLTLSPPSAGDPATTLPWSLLRPPPTIRGLHLHLGQVSLVLTHLVGSWGLPGLEDTGSVACQVWCLQETGAEDVCSEPQEDRPPCPRGPVIPCPGPLWVPPQHLALTVPSMAD